MKPWVSSYPVLIQYLTSYAGAFMYHFLSLHASCPHASYLMPASLFMHHISFLISCLMTPLPCGFLQSLVLYLMSCASASCLRMPHAISCLHASFSRTIMTRSSVLLIVPCPMPHDSSLRTSCSSPHTLLMCIMPQLSCIVSYWTDGPVLH
jgi:hypothetical protein